MTIKNTIQTLLGGSVLLLALASVGCSSKSDNNPTAAAPGKPAAAAPGKPATAPAPGKQEIEAAAPTAKWQEFTAEDAHFSISMPGKPQVSKDNDTTFYMVKDAKDGTIFSANVSGLPPQSAADVADPDKAKKDLDATCDAFLKESKAKELSREDITQDGWPGKTLKAEMAVEGTNQKMITYYKFIYAHDKMLLFAFTGPSDMDYTAATDQFYHSLKIEPKS